MAVVAFLPSDDAEITSKVESFSIARSYPIDHRVSDLDAARHILRKGDVLLMHSLLDLSSDDMAGLNIATDFTDKDQVTVVTVRENYVLKDDTMSHLLAGVCFLTKAVQQSYDEDKR